MATPMAMQRNLPSMSSVWQATISQNYTHQPHGDIRVRRAGHHLVVFAAAVETPHFVLVGVQRLHALVGLYGPQLY